MKATAFSIALLWTTAAIAGPLPTPTAEFAAPDPASVRLGQQLFYDPILSGNRNISCAACHHSTLGTSDGVSLSLGEGALGLGQDRRTGASNRPEARIPRNAPALFNLGATEFTVMFHDGRLEVDPSQPGGMRTPLGGDMVSGFKSALAAQAMFPVLSGDEMAGHYSENDISQAVRLGQLSHAGGAWDLIAARVAAIPEYRAQFDATIGADTPIKFTDIGNAMADFIAVEWRADNAPFDQYLRGEITLSADAQQGLDLFYGKAGCDSCHTGQFQTDHGFHAIAMPQIGPGKAAPFEDHFRDTGRMRVTGDTADAYAFRTPSLRNIALTGPYGHAGAYKDLEMVVRHHLDPVASLRAYDLSQAILHEFDEAEDWQVMGDPAEVDAIADANSLAAMPLSDAEVGQLLAFLHALTDLEGAKGRLGTPDTVPSGLPVDR